jgi:parallel beta-helix repeat protein
VVKMRRLSLIIMLTLSLTLFVNAEPQGRKGHAPICINGDRDFERWGIAGRGSGDEPYVIENIEIRSLTMNGIEVWNTKSHLVIRNVFIEGNGSFTGIYLYNVENVRIENCELKGNAFGILVQNSSNTVIMGCEVGNGSIGIFVNSSSNIAIIGSEALNSSVGIYVKLSLNCTAANCTLSKNKNGIMLDSSSSNMVYNCIVVENDLGIMLLSSTNSTIYNNRFNNEIDWHVAGNSTGNRWNVSKTGGRNIIGGPFVGGNHWSSYKGVDKDKDGIGDTDVPYGPGDYLPLVKYKNSPPKADFFHYPFKVKCMDEVIFLDNSTDPDGEVVSWMWDFGDGGNATGMSVRHVFRKKGNYTVRLRVMDDGGLEAKCEKAIVVYNSPPKAGFTYSPIEPRVNETIIFTSNSTDVDGRIASWEWEFGDGAKDTGENVTHAYRKEGNYTIVLLVRDEEGDTDWCFATISVKPALRAEGYGTEYPPWIPVAIIIIAIIAMSTYVMLRRRLAPFRG